MIYNLQKRALLYNFKDILNNESPPEKADNFFEIASRSYKEENDNYNFYIEEADLITRGYYISENKCTNLNSIFESLNSDTKNTYQENLTRSCIDNKISQSILDELKNQSDISPIQLLSTLKKYTSSIALNGYEKSDVSYYDHSRITAAVSSCLFLYHNENSYTDLKTDMERNKDKFLLVSGEFTGIQDFIYTTVSKMAMKSLRGRSFYPEIFTEHIIDEILYSVGLNRINLLYSGASLFYLLLPNKKDLDKTLENYKNKINDFLLKEFGNKLYFEMSYTTLSSDELGNGSNISKKNQNKIGDIFRRVSIKSSSNKISRYNKEQLQELFDEDSTQNATKSNSSECIICKKSESDNVIAKNIESEDTGCIPICNTCRSMILLGKNISKTYLQKNKDIITEVLINDFKNTDNIILPNLNDSFVEVKFQESNKVDKEKTYRVYNIFPFVSDIKDAITINVANYNITEADINDKNKENLIEFKNLVKKSKGIERLAVFRADVDNLGTLFQSGFIENNSNKYKNLSISKSVILSRKLTEFFKQKINPILEKRPVDLNGYIYDKYVNIYARNNLSSDNATNNCPTYEKGRDIVLVYSGGDDMFAIGTWNDIIEFAIDIQIAFTVYTNGKVTLSAGIGIFDEAYPVYNMANDTAKLEELAKHYTFFSENNKKTLKNAISLFGTVDLQKYSFNQNTIEKNILSHTYSWNEFIYEIINKKYKFLKEKTTVIESDNSKEKIFIGKSRWYNFMDLILRTLSSENNKIDVARFAYSLSRISVKKEQEEIYKDLKQTLFEWIKNQNDAKQLYTAITMIIYEIREK